MRLHKRWPTVPRESSASLGLRTRLGHRSTPIMRPANTLRSHPPRPVSSKHATWRPNCCRAYVRPSRSTSVPMLLSHLLYWHGFINQQIPAVFKLCKTIRRHSRIGRRNWNSLKKTASYVWFEAAQAHPLPALEPAAPDNLERRLSMNVRLLAVTLATVAGAVNTVWSAENAARAVRARMPIHVTPFYDGERLQISVG